MTCADRTGGRSGRPFVFLHVGDLHVTQVPDQGASPNWEAREHRLRNDLQCVLDDIGGIRGETPFDFVYLPGDLAENGCAKEYDVIAAALGSHPTLPVRLIPGDHDRARGAPSLEQFAEFRDRLEDLQAQRHPRKDSLVEKRETECPPPREPATETITQYYFEEEFAGVRCLFLDTVSAGQGQKGWGLDFRLGAGQRAWLECRIRDAKTSGKPCAVFMHCYPADIYDQIESTELAGLFWDGGVRIVEMGHTHYNEVAHDGRTMYAAARSLGQNEDGPAGYAVVALDGNVTSWRFKQLQLPWPFVMITSPADRRLATEPLTVDWSGRITVRALVLSDGELNPRKIRCRVDDGIWTAMHRVSGDMFEAKLPWRDGSRRVTVQVTDDRTYGKDRLDEDVIEPALPPGTFQPRPRPSRLGSPVATIGSWANHGLRGDPLGPNNGGHRW